MVVISKFIILFLNMERLKELENFLFLLPFTNKRDENKEIEFGNNQANNNKKLNKKRKRQRERKKNKNNNFKYDPDKKANLQELQEKVQYQYNLGYEYIHPIIDEKLDVKDKLLLKNRIY